MNKKIIIFTKYFDDLSSKTRLRKKLDSKWVDIFNEYCFEILKEKVQGFETIWSLRSNTKKIHPRYKDLNFHLQRGENLGEIIKNSVEMIDFKKCALLGMDTPHLNADIFKNDQEFQIGNTHDGGFYYFEFPKSYELNNFTKIQYSTSYTAKNLSATICDEIFEHPLSFDIDTFEDIKKLENFYKLHPPKGLENDLLNHLLKV